MNSQPASQLQDILSDSERFNGQLLSLADIQRFSLYYQLVIKWNDRLHLTTLTQPSAFAERHILESLFAESHLLPNIRKVWDLGSGLGIPGIPLAILRSDLLITLVEANKRKAVFLMEAVGALQLTNVTILNQRLESIRGVEPESCVTVRAIERMNQILPEILEVGSKCAQFLLFGSRETESIAVHWLPQDREMQSHLIPCSHHRLLLCLNRST